MNSEVPCVVGLRQEDAVETLKSKGIHVNVRFKVTRPPRLRVEKEPVSWRVIVQRRTADGVELVVTPEWVDWLSANASERK